MEVEGILIAKDLNLLERELVINNIKSRLTSQVRKQQTEDLMQGVNIKSFVKRFVKNDE